MQASRVMVPILRKIFGNHLFRNSAIFGVILGASEFTQETILNFQHYDTARIARVGFYGFAFNSPINHFALNFQEKLFPGTSVKRVLLKVGLGQVTTSPILVASFFVGINILEGKTDILTEVKDKFLASYLVGWLFWPPLQFLTFRMVPHHHRVAAVAVSCFIWGNFLCYMKTLDMHKIIQKPALKGQPLTTPSA